jgi:transketolase C-terminal domain/subunit
LAIVGTGSILAEAVRAANELAVRGIYADVFSLTKLTPLAKQDISPLHRYQSILTVEEHVAAGGLGEMLRMLLPSTVNLRTLSIPDSLCLSVGSQAWLRARANLDSAGIISAILEFIGNDGS